MILKCIFDDLTMFVFVCLAGCGLSGVGECDVCHPRRANPWAKTVWNLSRGPPGTVPAGIVQCTHKRLVIFDYMSLDSWRKSLGLEGIEHKIILM